MSRELEVLRQEYKRAVENPIFDDPQDYCTILDLITDRIEALEEEKVICTFCNDNSKSCRACDDGYEGE